MPITLDDIRAARARIGSGLAPTPCVVSALLGGHADAAVSLKLETLQTTGAFKERGALNKLATLDDDQRRRGVIAASAGNHAQAVGLHAGRLGIAATVVMPETTPLIKVDNTRAHGAEVVLAGATYDDAYEAAVRIGHERDRVFVHPFDDDAVIAGQGTLGLEILEQLPSLDVLVVPVGGGGMLAGIATAVRALRPSVRIVGVQAERVPGMHAALAAGAPVRVPAAATLADGVAVRTVSERTLEVVRRCVDDVVLVGEDEIAAAILALLERQKVLAEGAGAVAVAALLARKVGDLRGRNVCAVVSGGNIDVTTLGKVIDRGLVGEGRYAVLHVRIRDRPGALAEITAVLARTRANVVDIRHERAFSHAVVSDAEVFVTLETRGHAHLAEIRAALEGVADEVTVRV